MKAKIIKIGTIENSSPYDWSFESYTSIPALNTSDKGTLYYGYTIGELEAIRKNMTPYVQMFDVAA